MNQCFLGFTAGKLLDLIFIEHIASECMSVLGNEGKVVVKEIVEASLEVSWRDIVAIFEGSVILAEGELELICGHDDFVAVVVVVAFVNL